MPEKHLSKIVVTVILTILIGWYLLGRQTAQTDPSRPEVDQPAPAEVNSSTEEVAEEVNEKLTEDPPLVSSIQPVSEAELGIMSGVLVPPKRPVTEETARRLSEMLLQSKQLIESGDTDQAIALLQSTITEYPLAPEPYINLASIHSRRGQLDEARNVLLKAIRADRRSAVLFDSLQSVHGAQAARAYQQALNQENPPGTGLELPMVTELEASVAPTGTANQLQRQAVIALIERWASDWQSADIERHVTRYAIGFSPSANDLSHAQWVEQRRQQLTNQVCRQSEAANIQIDDLGSQFTVTFSHRCRSDDSDQSIDKKLVFEKQGDDWSQAKIIDETILSS